MALPLIGSIAPETFAQANPFLTGWAAAQGIQDQGYKNQIDAATAKYADPTAAAALAYSQAQTPYLQAQTQQIIQGGIPKDQADANLANAQAKFAGLMAMSNYLKGAGYYNRNSPSMLGVTASNTPAGQAVAANNPTVASNVANNVKAVTSGSAFVNALQQDGVQNPTANIPFPTSATPQQTPLSKQVQQQNGQIFMGAAPNTTSSQPMVSLPQQLQQNQQQTGSPFNKAVQTPGGTILNSDAAAIQAVAQNAIASKTHTPQQIAAITYENSANNMFKNIIPSLPAIASYSGANGLAKLKMDQLHSSFPWLGGQPSQQYQAYQNYETQATLAANEIRRSFQGQATDTENKLINEVTNPVAFDLTPQQTLGKWQALFQAMHANTQAVLQTKQQNIAQATNAPEMQVPGAPQNTPQRITVTSPDGTTGTISASNLQAALQAGYKQVSG